MSHTIPTFCVLFIYNLKILFSATLSSYRIVNIQKILNIFEDNVSKMCVSYPL